MTRNEQQLYSDVTSIKESLKKIANALETNVPTTPKPKDIPGFEGTLDALDVLCDIKTITDDYASNKELHDLKLHTDEGKSCDDDHVHNDYLNDLVTDMTKEQYVKFHLDMDFGFALSDAVSMTNHIYDLEYEEVLDCIKSALNVTGENDVEERIERDVYELKNQCCSDNEFCKCVTSENPDPAGYGNKDPYTYDNDLNEYCDGIKNDSDHDIRSTAQYYKECLALDSYENLNTKKDCILDYVTNEFGVLGARYTDIIKFAYYLGEHNKLKYDSRDRGYYSCAFATRYGGHLIQGGNDFLVKGINKEGKERYFAHSSVDSFTDYYKRIA